MGPRRPIYRSSTAGVAHRFYHLKHWLMAEKKFVTPPEYIAEVIASLHETHFFEENRITEDEVKKEFWEKITWKAEVNDGHYALDEEEIDEVLCKCIDIAVDNSLAFITEKGLAQMHVQEGGDIYYEATNRAKAFVDPDRVVAILQGKIK